MSNVRNEAELCRAGHGAAQGRTGRRKTTVLLALAIAFAGCTHAMHVRNLQQYTQTSSSPKKLTLALRNRALGGDDAYFGFVQEALATHPSVERVTVVKWDEQPETATDYIVEVSPSAVYGGSGWNYLITFPGFLVFTHAWNGFVYTADVKTNVALKAPDGEALTTEVDTNYDLRFCDFDRGAATSSGWYTPGWGGLNLFIGFAMVGYDPDATPEFQREIRSAYGQYVANSIIQMAADAQAKAHAVSAAGSNMGAR